MSLKAHDQPDKHNHIVAQDCDLCLARCYK